MKNKTVIKILLFSFLIFLAQNQNSFSQNQTSNRNSLFVLGDSFFSQTIAIPNSTMDSINIIFCYSFVFDGLVFQKNNENEYFATPILEASFRDNGGIIRRRLLTNDTVVTNNFSETISRQTSFSNVSIFTLPLSNYSVSVRLTNGKSSRNPTLETRIQGFDSLTKSETILRPFFMNPTERCNVVFQPFLSNNFIPFSAKNFTVFVPVSISKNSDNISYSYKIERKETSGRNISWGDFYSVSGDFELRKNSVFTAKKLNNEIQISNLQEKYFDENFDFAVLKIDVSMAQFSPANYSINIKNNQTHQERNFDFEVRWNDIPLSLSDPEIAAENMHLILTDSEFRQLRRGNRTEIFNNILTFWRQKDPTPGTEYNEAMSEYFRRVDFATVNFETVTQRDGAKSDRGKVHILNGFPDRIENIMHERRSREIWFYEQLQKKYIFDLVSVGVFRLVAIEEL